MDRSRTSIARPSIPLASGRSLARSSLFACLLPLVGAGCATAPGAARVDAGNDARVEARVVALETALKRWDRCVDRVHRGRIGTPRSCEGYRRDVTATFPAHLEHQVRDALVTRERRGAVNGPVDAFIGTRPLDRAPMATGSVRERMGWLLRRTGHGTD